MSIVDQLLGRAVVLVAHPDDECIAYGALLQRMREPHVICATDGAPRDPQFWEKWGTREAYANLRRKEATWALERVGVGAAVYLSDDSEHGAAFADQELYLALPQAYALLRARLNTLKPEAIATLAYEGGHPDHDSCNVLASALGEELRIPVWEAPLYRSHEDGTRVLQQFVSGDAGIEIVPTAEESARKRQMCVDYSSQGDFLGTFKLERETVRPLARYDYSQPPHSGKLNYELWGWRMTGSEVSAEFVRFMRWWQLRQRQAA
jgi:LmbE family N-acetylglucosaminyl deacetylase